MLTRRDYLIVVLVGFFTGVFAVPTVVNLGIRSYTVLMSLPLAVPILFAFGLWWGKFLSRWFAFFAQFAKFAAVGFLNTAIDFGVLNILSLATGVTKGFILGGVNVPGFTLAVVNSYFWNKYWVFKGRESVASELPKFLAVTFIGLLINSGLIVLITTYVTPLLGFQASVWLNLAKVFATTVSLMWNFAGYKFLVFKS